MGELMAVCVADLGASGREPADDMTALLRPRRVEKVPNLTIRA